MGGAMRASDIYEFNLTADISENQASASALTCERGTVNNAFDDVLIGCTEALAAGRRGHLPSPDEFQSLRGGVLSVW